MKKINEITAPIIYAKRQNMMASTAAVAPFIGAVQSRGTIETPELIAAMREDGCAESELEIARVLDKMCSYLTVQVGENHCKVHCYLGIAEPHITKSFPTVDAPLAEGVNELVMRVTLGEDLRSCLSDITPKEDAEARATLGGPEIYSVHTEEFGFDIIAGTRHFVAAGLNLDLQSDRPGDRLELVSKKTGGVTEITDYETDGEGLRVKARCTAALAKGVYTLKATVVDAETGVPLSALRNVTVVEDENPPPPQAPVLSTLTNLEGRSFSNTDTDGYLNGEHLAGATVRAEYGTRLVPSEETLDWSEFTSEEFSCEVESDSKIRFHQKAGFEVSAYAYRYTVTTAGGAVTKTFE